MDIGVNNNIIYKTMRICVDSNHLRFVTNNCFELLFFTIISNHSDTNASGKRSQLYRYTYVYIHWIVVWFLD